MALHVVIVGAGLSGLATALTLAKKGHKVQVMEQASGLRTAGGDIVLWPNGTRFLIEEGLEQAALPMVCEMKALTFYRYANAEHLGTASVLKEGQPYPHWLFKRSDLQQVLYEAAIAAGATVHFGRNVKHVDQDQPAIDFEGSDRIVADLVIAADGIKSHLRSQILGEGAAAPVVTETCSFFSCVPREVVEADPEIRHLYPSKGEFQITMGPNRWLMGYPMPQKGYYGLSCGVTTYGRPARVNHWNGDGDPDELRSKYDFFAPVYRKLLSYVTQCDKWQIADGPPVERWTSQSGKVVIIGDAAHAMLPHVGQGANQCLEDASAVAEFLDPDVLKQHNNNISLLMTEFGKMRMARTDHIRHKSQDQGATNVLPDGPVQEQRDAVLKAMAQMPPPPPWDQIVADAGARMHEPGWQKWVQGYDMILEARQAIRSIPVTA